VKAGRGKLKTRGRKPRVISFVFVLGTWNTRKGDKIGAVLQQTESSCWRFFNFYESQSENKSENKIFHFDASPHKPFVFQWV
ncbi:MAG: hypothetical protein ABSF34_12940, partial [Verrucomicrobiota bacterium]